MPFLAIIATTAVLTFDFGRGLALRLAKSFAENKTPLVFDKTSQVHFNYAWTLVLHDPINRLCLYLFSLCVGLILLDKW